MSRKVKYFWPFKHPNPAKRALINHNARSISQISKEHFFASIVKNNTLECISILRFQPIREHWVLNYSWVRKDVYQILVLKSFSQVLDIGWGAEIVSCQDFARREVFLAIRNCLKKTYLLGVRLSMILLNKRLSWLVHYNQISDSAANIIKRFEINSFQIILSHRFKWF